jgi:hypothetical protein
MAPWHRLIGLTYLTLLVVLTCPVLLVLSPAARLSELAVIFVQWWYWACLGAVALGQVALLVVPVRVAKRRPVRRRSLLLPLGLTGLLTALLALGTLLALVELAHGGTCPSAGGAGCR